MLDAEKTQLIMTFIVEREGRLSDIQVPRHQGYDIDKQTIKIVSGMRSWIPAEHNNRIVRSQLTIPITIQINKKQ